MRPTAGGHAKQKCSTTLFLSVDLAGSTAYKNEKLRESTDWVESYIGFYTEFPRLFERNWIDLCAKACPAESVRDGPHLWKPIGDQLVFTLDVNTELDALLGVVAFRAALFQWAQASRPSTKESSEKSLSANTLRLTLPLKGAAWTVVCPWPNWKFDFDSNGEGSTRTEYIGFSVDIGFRLASFATDRRLILSAELAWLVASAFTAKRQNEFHALNQDTFECTLRRHGTEPLKGVLEEQKIKYPVYWLDVWPKDQQKAADELGESGKSDLAAVLRDLTSFFGKVETFGIRVPPLDDNAPDFDRSRAEHTSIIERHNSRKPRNVVTMAAGAGSANPRLKTVSEQNKRLLETLARGDDRDRQMHVGKPKPKSRT